MRHARTGMSSSRAFTLIELVISMSVLVIIVVGLAVALNGNGRHPFADADELHALLVRARAEAVTNGQGATLGIAPNAAGGTAVALYAFRPYTGTSPPAPLWTQTFSESVISANGQSSAGIFFDPSGAATTASWTVGQTIATEPACANSVSLTITATFNPSDSAAPLQLDCASGTLQ